MGRWLGGESPTLRRSSNWLSTSYNFHENEGLTLCIQKSIASGTLRLRAERDANGNGRVYLIRMTATDAFANTSRKCIAAVVPKSQSPADVSNVTAMAQAAASVCNATGNPPAGYFTVGDVPVVGPKQ